MYKTQRPFRRGAHHGEQLGDLESSRSLSMFFSFSGRRSSCKTFVAFFLGGDWMMDRSLLKKRSLPHLSIRDNAGYRSWILFSKNVVVLFFDPLRASVSESSLQPRVARRSTSRSPAERVLGRVLNPLKRFKVRSGKKKWTKRTET